MAAWRTRATRSLSRTTPICACADTSAGFTRLAEWDFEAACRRYPLAAARAVYFDLYRRQVIKQADLMLAQYWFGPHFDDEDKARNVDYYERRTVVTCSSCPPPSKR